MFSRLRREHMVTDFARQSAHYDLDISSEESAHEPLAQAASPSLCPVPATARDTSWGS